MIHARVSRAMKAGEEIIAEIHFSVTEESIPGFKELVRRALNCWPDAHPELKELGDMLEHGKVLQDYYHQRSDLPRK